MTECRFAHAHRGIIHERKSSRHGFVTVPSWVVKIIRSLALLLASAAFLSAADSGRSRGETYTSVSPNGRFSVHAPQGQGYYKFKVEIRELPASTPIISFDPKARFIEAAWNVDSKLVAIDQNLGTHANAVSVFSVGKKTVRQLSLPSQCENDSAVVFEPPARRQGKKAAALKFHWASDGLQVVKWLSADKLLLSASGRGWWGGDVAKGEDSRFLADYELTIHFGADGKSSLRVVVLKKYEEM